MENRIFLTMETKRVKRNRGTKVENEPNIMAEDRISQLPDPVIHYIFSFIPTVHLVQMSSLSRRWRRMWVSTPFLYFDESNDVVFIRKVKKGNMFLKFVGNYLRHRKQFMQADMFITSFKLHHSYFKLRRTDVRRVDGWVRFAIESKVKELDLHVRDYCIPQSIYTESSLTQLKFHGLKFEVPSLSTLSSLTQLELRYLKLEAPCHSMFPTLKVLCLVDVESDYNSLQNLISGCPMIEDLHLQQLTKINCPLLEYHYLDISFIDFPAKALKNLSLSSVVFSDQGLESLISGLPLLERFTLDYCYKVKNLSIHSHSLKYLSFSEYFYILNATFRTPNLVHLDLKLRSFGMSVISIEAPNLFQANLRLSYSYKSADLVHFLSNLHGLKKMMLSMFCEQDMIFPEAMRNTLSPPLPNLKHLDAIIYGDRKKNSDLQDFLVWCAPSIETFMIQGKSSYYWFST
ncbi:putative F-box/LRR-repeat protein At3g28410 isoform X1 [Ziziphus jujuba]|uniref:F-box/LRR-repeat protein At3g28410 isoform X1 n=1 Tax=Ziziphus jujuba TaxID=326968 RepID=A0A6P3ZYH3_ZIZJJ|nr:putative F-box/LRR-repeat protein At3g28410 isoform X1 [Ziziphus jujuba]